jgi:hypothetical protein
LKVIEAFFMIFQSNNLELWYISVTQTCSLLPVYISVIPGQAYRLKVGQSYR